MKDIWRTAVERFIVNHMETMGQDELDQWLDGRLDLEPKMETTLWSLSEHKDMIMRQMHQISPAEILDLYEKERPGARIKDKNKAILRIGKELESIKAYLAGL